MNERERISTLVAAGSITEDEAEILLAALEESHESHKNYESRESEKDRLAPPTIPAEHDGMVPPVPPISPVPPVPPMPVNVAFQQEITTLASFIEKKVEQSENVSQEIEAHSEVMAQLAEQSAALNEELQQLQATMAEAAQEETAQLQKDISQREEDITQMQAQQVEQKVQIEALEHDLQHIKQEIADTEKVMHDLIREAPVPEMESFTTEDGQQVYIYRTGGEHKTKEEAAQARARIINAMAAQHIAQSGAEAEHKHQTNALMKGDKAARKAAKAARKAARRESKESKRKPAIIATENPSFNSAIHRFISGLVHGEKGEKHSYIPTNDKEVPENWLKLSGFCGDLTVRCNPAIEVPRVEGNATLTQTEAGGYLIKTPASSGGGWLKNLHKVASDIVVEVPEHTSLELSMTAGDAKIIGVESLIGSFVGGDFEAQRITGLDLLITAGDVTLSTLLHEGTHQLAVVAGDVTLDFLQGSAVHLEASGRGGDISLRTAATMQEQSELNFKKDFSCTLGEASDTPAQLHFLFTAGDITINDTMSTAEVKE